MALLTDAVKQAIAAALQSTNTETHSLLKADWKVIADAADAWIEANEAGFNAAIPQPQRGRATAKQKTAIFVAVALKRRDML